MIDVRVTDAAVAAACRDAAWDWQRDAYVDAVGRWHVIVPSPAECMRPILEAAAPHMTVDGLGAMLGRLERAQNVSDVEDVCQDVRAFLGLPREDVSPWATT